MLTKTILSKNTKEDLNEYLNLCSSYVSMNTEDMFDFTLKAVKYHKTDKSVLKDLETRWYDSLECDSPDYSVYDSKYFLINLWVCWVIYSRKYLLAIKANKDIFEKIDSIADLGCGVGYTTAGLKELFPNADVFGTNFEDGVQYRIAQVVGKESGFEMIPNITQHVDFILASEYFEHVENAVEHLEDILDIATPNYLVVANAFNTISVGHFPSYFYKGKYYDAKTTSRMFNKVLRSRGYEKVKTNCWNDRPSFWKKG